MARPILAAVVGAVFAVTALAAVPGTAAAQTTWDVAAGDNFWDPDEVVAQAGDSVRWGFDEASGFHTLLLRAPGGPDEMLGDSGDPEPVVRELEAAGEYLFWCSLHGGPGVGMSGTVTVSGVGDDQTAPTTTASLDPPLPGVGGTYAGPVTVTLAADDGPDGSGVDVIRYSLDGGAAQEYEGPFTVSAVGAHTIAYGATDLAGNVEESNDLTFTIASPDPDPGPGPVPSPDPGTPPASTPPAAVGTPPSVTLEGLPRRLALAALLRSGLRVEAACSGVERGTLTLTAGRRLLGKQSIRCDGTGAVAGLEATARAERALRKARRPVRAVLTVSMSGPGGAADDRHRLLLTPGR
jgi:plastocyanin